MKKPLKIQFIDMGYDLDGWGYYSDDDQKDTFLYKSISQKYNIKIVNQKPDIIIGGWATNNFYKHDAKYIFMGSEHYFPNGLFADYRIHNKYKSLGKNDFYCADGFPIDEYENFIKGEKKNLFFGKKVKKTQFCNFIFSNKYSKKRNDFILKMLKRYGNDIHCWGRYKNNIKELKVNNKIVISEKQHYDIPPREIMSHYKFSICFENSSAYHSFSEKVPNALRAGSIPIYWGGEAIYKFVKRGAFIDANDFKNLDELIDYIDKVNNDDELYNSYIMENPFVNDDFIRGQFSVKLAEFIEFVVNDKNYKHLWWKNRRIIVLILPLLVRFYKTYWKIKSLKRRFIGGK